jgi:hypothetical protein
LQKTGPAGVSGVTGALEHGHHQQGDDVDDLDERFIAGPPSLRSPTVSPASPPCGAGAFAAEVTVFDVFFALSHAPPPVVIEIATKGR